MKHSEIVTAIARQTGKEPKKKDIAMILGLSYEAIKSRSFRDKEYSHSEVEKIETYYNVILSKRTDINRWIDNMSENYAKSKTPVLDSNFDMSMQYEFDKWGKRLLMLLVQSGMLDTRDFANFLDIPEKRLDSYIMESKPPTGEDLLKIKTRFSKTSLDWLLFGII